MSTLEYPVSTLEYPVSSPCIALYPTNTLGVPSSCPLEDRVEYPGGVSAEYPVSNL